MLEDDTGGFDYVLIIHHAARVICRLLAERKIKKSSRKAARHNAKFSFLGIIKVELRLILCFFIHLIRYTFIFIVEPHYSQKERQK